MDAPPPDSPAPVSLPTATTPAAPWAETARRQHKFSLVPRLLFFLGVFPIAFLIALSFGYWHLLILMVLMLAVVNLFETADRVVAAFPKVREMGLIGKGLGFSYALRSFYVDNAPRPFLYYVLFPIAGPIAMILRASARREFGLYIKVLLTFLILVLIELVVSYPRTYPPHLGITEAVTIGGLQVLVSFLFLVVLLMPTVTTAYTWNLSGRRYTLRIVTVLALAISVFFAVLYVKQAKHVVSPFSMKRLKQRMKTKAFKNDLRIVNSMFLRHMAWWASRRKKPPQIPGLVWMPEITDKYRSVIAGFARRDEPRAFFVIGFPLKPGGRIVWGVILRDRKKLRLVQLVGPTGGEVYQWSRLPPALQKGFLRVRFAQAYKRQGPTIVGRFVPAMLADW